MEQNYLRFLVYFDKIIEIDIQTIYVIVRAVRVGIVQITRKARKLVWWFSMTVSTFWPIAPKIGLYQKRTA